MGEEEAVNVVMDPERWFDASNVVDESATQSGDLTVEEIRRQWDLDVKRMEYERSKFNAERARSTHEHAMALYYQGLELARVKAERSEWGGSQRAGGVGPVSPQVPVSPRWEADVRGAPINSKDVPKLTWEMLDSVEWVAKTNIVFAYVESGGGNDTSKINRLISKLGPDLDSLAHTMLTEQPNMSWDQMKNHVCNTMLGNRSSRQALEDIKALSYDGQESVNVYISKMKMRFKLFESRFPGQGMPESMKFIKQRVADSLPRDLQQMLTPYITEVGDWQHFMDEFNKARWMEEGRQLTQGQVFKVKEETRDDAEFNQMKRNIAQLESQVRSMHLVPAPDNQSKTLSDGETKGAPYLTPPKQYYERANSDGRQVYQQQQFGAPVGRGRGCPFCRQNNHTVETCLRKPNPRSCYNCLRLGCRPWDSSCPGRLPRGHVNYQ